MNISFEYYKIFYYVAKYKNITQAAKIIHNNQPNVSRTIKLLEHELGCSLIQRSNRGICLTPEGDRLYQRIRIAVEQIQLAEEEIIMSTRLQDGVISIGTSETALHLLLLPVLHQFKQRYPEIRIRISNNLTSQAIEAVKNGLVDFSVVASPANVEKPLSSSSIMDFHDILIGGPAYSFLSDTVLSLKELQHYPLVCLAENTMTYLFYSSFYRNHDLILKPELEAATIDQVLPIIKNDLGVGFIPEVFAEDALKKKEVCTISLTEEIPIRQICFVENENHPLSFAAKELKNMLMQYKTKG